MPFCHCGNWKKILVIYQQPFRQRLIVDYVKRAHGLEANPDQVVVTPGAKPVVFFAILALIEPGDDVLCPGPGYPTYESMIDYVGARAVPYRLREENDFRFDPDEFRATVTPKTRLIIVNSPQNPTGGVLERSDLEVIAEVAQERDIMVLSDEIYHRLIYEGEHVSIATLPGMQERTILMDGFSKTYAMTGWRLGYGVMPEDLAQAMAILQVNSTACAADFTQVAAIEALSGPQTAVEDMLAQFRKRREVIVDGRILPEATGSILRLPQYQTDRAVIERDGFPPVGRSRGGSAGRVGLWRVRRWVPAAELRQLDREYPACAGEHAPVLNGVVTYQ